MTIMGHNDFARHRRNVDIIHERRAKFASDQRGWRLLPVEGSAAATRRNALADVVGYAALAIGAALLTYMLGRIIYAAL